jgi:hypothetical protein
MMRIDVRARESHIIAATSAGRLSFCNGADRWVTDVEAISAPTRSALCSHRGMRAPGRDMLLFEIRPHVLACVIPTYVAEGVEPAGRVARCWRARAIWSVLAVNGGELGIEIRKSHRLDDPGPRVDEQHQPLLCNAVFLGTTKARLFE